MPTKKMKKLLNYFKYLNRQRNYKTRELKRRAGLISFAKKLDNKKDTPIDITSIKRILFPFVDLGIGDAVCHTGLWSKLKDAGYVVQVIIEKRNRVLFEKLTYIDELFVIDLNNINALEKIETDLVIGVYSWMKRKEYFSNELLAHIDYKYAINIGGWLKHPYNISLSMPNDFHITDPQKNILDILSIPAENLAYSLPSHIPNDDFIEQYLKIYSGKKYIVINPFASVEERSLSTAQLEKIAFDLAKENNIHIFIVGEKKKLDLLSIPHENVSICIFNSLWDTISLIRKADLVISVDTAIVHIASALNKNLLAIYYSMLLDHNEAFQGNIIFSPLGEKAKQLIFNKTDKIFDLGVVHSEAIALLNNEFSNNNYKLLN